MAEASKAFVDRGFRGLKIKVGDVMLAKGWSRENFESELAKLQAALEVVPRSVYIDADANQGWRSAKWTVAVLERFRDYDNLSTEQPLPYADLDGAVFVRRHSRVPVILDESVWSPEAVLQLVRMGACDRIVMKLNRIGGFLPALRAITICEAAGVGVSVDTNPYTILGDTASCHIAAVASTPYPVDCEGHVSFLDIGSPNPFRGGITFAGGLARLPDAPGLGVDVDWDVLKQHQKKHTPLADSRGARS
jgi:L-alanine-DL-glutamate epimerase-like enolase superfamily enzyme